MLIRGASGQWMAPGDDGKRKCRPRFKTMSRILSLEEDVVEKVGECRARLGKTIGMDRDSSGS